ncbi:hypothetical protein [Burkholderia pseudomallei]|uniref:hypothetical protein n=1 Tax=Burkholderia pseudomallei TaxID=28450 RepID=UPI0005107665|nr:hypothetical protein [Burkholderia pseudomallei]KGC28045.1 hypothetical protein DO64_2820 [Burkholderia pseudomallei]
MSEFVSGPDVQGEVHLPASCPKLQLAAAGRGSVKTLNSAVFGCRFTLPVLSPSQYSAIGTVDHFDRSVRRAFSHSLGHEASFARTVA